MEKGSKIFITGATGFIGEKLALHLAESGFHVQALVRNVNKTPSLHREGIQLIAGDINNREDVLKASDQCRYGFHLAGFVQLWHKDDSIFERVNVEGTRTVMDAAHKNGLKRIVFTSTAGVFGPALDGKVGEDAEQKVPLSTEYEITKLQAEKEALQFIDQGLEVVIVNPTRVFGPGLISKSNAVTMLIDRYSLGKWRMLPGDGKRLGNYVFVDDIIQGQILAMERGKSGENYILGGDSVSYSELFHLIGELSGKQHWMVPIPTKVMMAMAKFQMWKANTIGSEPLITPGFARKYLYDWDNSIEKAKRDLKYHPMSLKEGIRKTLDWLKASRG